MLNKQRMFVIAMIVLISMMSILIISCDSQNRSRENSSEADYSFVYEQNKKLGRGININCNNRMRPEDFKIIKDAGFDSVRLVVNWASQSEPTPPYTIEPSWFETVDMGIEQALANGLPIVLDFHYFPLFSFTGRRTSDLSFEEARAWFLGIWEQVAEHYKDASSDVMFEIMNEPSNYLGPERFNDIQNAAIEIIRKTNPNRTIVAGTECWNRSYTLANLMLPEDDHNIIVAVHCYEPLDFTHQGATYVDGAENWIGTTWTKTALERHELLEDFYRAAAFSAKYKRPIHLNEFGAIRYADMESRARYNYFLTRQAEMLGMSWAYWAFVDGLFGAYDRSTETWVESILNALIPPEE